jgi:hypothetical protein
LDHREQVAVGRGHDPYVHTLHFGGAERLKFSGAGWLTERWLQDPKEFGLTLLLDSGVLGSTIVQKPQFIFKPIEK